MRLAIEKLSHEGRGIAHRDGKICFVTGALQGETVEARRIASRARHDEYSTVAVVTPSRLRVTPPCPHYGACGGCDLQHLDPTAQREHKMQVVLETLARMARMTPRVVEAPIESAPLHYRTRARLAIDARTRGAPSVGFREGSSAAIVPIATCSVLDSQLAPLPSALAAFLAELDQPRAIGHVDLALSESGDETFPVIGIRLVRASTEPDRARAAAFGAAHRAYVALDDGQSPATYLHRPSDEPPGYRLPALDLRLRFEPGDFVQGNAAVNRALVRRVVDWTFLDAPKTVLDAFCGLGNFSLALARAGAHVLGVEVDRGMVARARLNAASNAVTGVELAQRDLQSDELALPRKRFDAVVLDPPRTGARALVHALAEQRIASLVYVSCMPGSLGRDARLLADAGYALDRLAIVDMFPQTSHVEAIARFVRARR